MKHGHLKYEHFWERLDCFLSFSKQFRTPEYAEILELFDLAYSAMAKSEYAYEKARELLDPETEDDLVLYVASCEEWRNAFTFVAYEMGFQEGRRGAPLSPPSRDKPF